MHVPNIIFEKNEKRYALCIIGILTIGFLITVNILLKFFIKKGQEKREVTKKQLLSMQKQSLRPEFTKMVKLDSKCPGQRAGNPSANLTIQYFYSPVCFWCVLEDQHFDELLQKEGQAFHLEKFNREDCNDVMQKYKLSLTPSFVFSTKNDSQEYTVDGYISKENLTKVICDVAGYCLKDENTPQKPQFHPIPEGQKVKVYYQ